jgi:hypothetical protein
MNEKLISFLVTNNPLLVTPPSFVHTQKLPLDMQNLLEVIRIILVRLKMIRQITNAHVHSISLFFESITRFEKYSVVHGGKYNSTILAHFVKHPKQLP